MRTVEVPIEDLERLVVLAEVGANGMCGQPRSAALARVRYVEALLVTARESKSDRGAPVA